MKATCRSAAGGPWTPNFRRRSFSAGKDRFFPCSLKNLHAIRPGAVPGANILLTWNCIHTLGWPPNHAHQVETCQQGETGKMKKAMPQLKRDMCLHCTQKNMDDTNRLDCRW